jgi:hypothetical protein
MGSRMLAKINATIPPMTIKNRGSIKAVTLFNV